MPKRPEACALPGSAAASSRAFSIAARTSASRPSRETEGTGGMGRAQETSNTIADSAASIPTLITAISFTNLTRYYTPWDSVASEIGVFPAPAAGSLPLVQIPSAAQRPPLSGCRQRERDRLLAVFRRDRRIFLAGSDGVRGGAHRLRQ